MTQLITTELVELDQNLGTSPEDVIRHLASKVAATGRASEVEGLFADAFAREQKTATGIPGGIAIPHCRSAAVVEPTLAMARLNPKVDFGAKDGPADLIFFIAAPDGADQAHLKLLSKLARSLIKKDFTAALRNASSREENVELVDGALADKPAAHAAAAPAHAAAAGAGAAPALAAACAAGLSARAPSTSSTISSRDEALRSAAVKSFLIRDRASFESSFRWAWSAPSGAAMKKIRSAGPSFAPKSTLGFRRAMARVGSVTAAERQCGMAMPPGMPVAVFCSRAKASAKRPSTSDARPVAATLLARCRITASGELPRFWSSSTSSVVMSWVTVNPFEGP